MTWVQPWNHVQVEGESQPHKVSSHLHMYNKTWKKIKRSIYFGFARRTSRHLFTHRSDDLSSIPALTGVKEPTPESCPLTFTPSWHVGAHHTHIYRVMKKTLEAWDLIVRSWYRGSGPSPPVSDNCRGGTVQERQSSSAGQHNPSSLPPLASAHTHSRLSHTYNLWVLLSGNRDFTKHFNKPNDKVVSEFTTTS